jgi:hypothetical protein
MSTRTASRLQCKSFQRAYYKEQKADAALVEARAASTSSDPVRRSWALTLPWSPQPPWVGCQRHVL